MIRELDSLLPVKKNMEDEKKRMEYFVGFDPNGNGILSLAEVEKGIFIYFFIIF